MSTLDFDRAGRLRNTPSFLAPVGESERRLPRLGAFVALGIVLAILAITLAVAVVMGVSVAVLTSHGQSVTQALDTLTQSDRTGRTLLSYSYELATAGLSLFAAAAVIIALAARFHRRPIRSFITSAPRFRWRLFGLGVAVAVPVILLAVLAELSWNDTPLDIPILHGASLADALGYAAVAAVFLFLAALAEEMVFRGWLLQQTSAFTRNVFIMVAVNGVLFSLIHLDPNPGAFVVRAIMGAGWAWIALRLGGLEFGVGAHLANNMIVCLLVKPLTLTPPVAEETDYRSVLAQLAIVGVTIAVVEWLTRRQA